MTHHSPELVTARLLENLYAIAGILLVLGALKLLWVDVEDLHGGAGDVEGSLKFQFISGVIYLIAITIIAFNYRHFVPLLLNNKILCLLVGLVIVSFLWSVLPGVTLRRSIALVGTTLFATYLVLRYTPRELVVLIAWACTIAAVAGLALVFSWPEAAIHGVGVHEGSWRGVFEHKNLTGRTMVLGTLACVLTLFMRSSSPFTRAIAITGTVCCTIFVIMATSRTGWAIGGLLTFLLLPLFVLRRGSPRHFYLKIGLLGTLFFAVAAYLTVQFAETGLGLVGRDFTLTGRTKLWSLAVEFGSNRPLLGYGYRVFWTEQNAGALYGRLWDGASMGHAHNGFIDVWLDIGFIGLLLVLLLLVGGIARSLRHLGETDGVLSYWFPLALAFVALAGMTEQTILTHSSIEWTVFVTTILYLSFLEPARQSIPRRAINNTWRPGTRPPPHPVSKSRSGQVTSLRTYGPTA